MCFSFVLSAGDQKPPLAPKPKVIPAPVRTQHPPASKLCVYQHTSPAAKCKVKPDVAPKPCLSKLSPPAFNPKHLKSTVGHQAVLQQKSDVSKNVGALNFRNETHNGNNKPEWDYIIPICVCNKRNCVDCLPKENNQSVRRQSPDKYKASKTEGPRKSPPKPPLRTPEEQKHLVTPTLFKCISEHSSSNSNHFHPTEKPQKTSQIQSTDPLKPHQNGSEMQSTRKHQNNIVSSVNSSVDHDLEHVERQKAVSSVKYCPSPYKPTWKAPPVVRQRTTKKEQSNIVLQQSTGLTKTEFTVLPIDVNNLDSLQRDSPNKVNINAVKHSRENEDPHASTSVKSTQGAPIPVPRQKIPRMQQNKTQDAGVHETGKTAQNLDATSEVVEISNNKHLKKMPQEPRPDGHRHDNTGPTELSVDKLPKKTSASKSPQRNDGKIAEGPPLAVEKKQASNVPNKKTLKPKSKSLSSADHLKPYGLKNTSFVRIMDLDRGKKVPKLSVKSGQADDLALDTNDRSVDTEKRQRKICSQKSMPLYNGHPDGLNLRRAVNGNILGVEQSVDEDLENVGESEHTYEDITEYEILPPSSTATTQDGNKFKKYEDDGIYEDPDVFPEQYVDAKEQQFLE
ncbi:hypothetical protein M9458_048953, partial [Cirrhinus mrigala]